MIKWKRTKKREVMEEDNDEKVLVVLAVLMVIEADNAKQPYNN